MKYTIYVRSIQQCFVPHYIKNVTTDRTCEGISYTLKRNRRQRNLRLHISSEGKVIVSAPYFASISEIDAFVSGSSDWIARHTGKVSFHDYETGDFVPYLGRKMTLLVIEGKVARYDIVDDKIIITSKNQDIKKIKEIIRKLYVETVEKVLKERVPFWCRTIGVDVPEFGVNRAKGKWGVCYPQEKRLYLSYMCATLPEDLMDMTVLHEVCHLRFRGHGRDFWNLMKANMGDLDERKTRLSEITKSGWTYNIV